MAIARVNAAHGEARIDELSILLRDAVEGGASAGFVTRQSLTRLTTTGKRCRLHLFELPPISFFASPVYAR
jgi:hypothetical protein